MSAKHRRPLIDPSVAYTDMSEDELFSLWAAYYPAGSGPLGVMRTLCAVIESLAYMKDMNVASWPNRYENQLNR